MIFRSMNMMKTFNHLLCPRVSRRHISDGTLTFNASTRSRLRRSYLYVPSSSQKMLEKSLESTADVIIYDLEDSVPPTELDKVEAREMLVKFLKQRKSDLPDSQRIAVRVNGISTPFFSDDVAQVLATSAVGSLVLPKIHVPRDLSHVSRAIYVSSQASHDSSPYVGIIASIESARGLHNVGPIATWRSEYGPRLGGRLNALLFAAEDYCADTSVLRTPSRRELLYARSAVVTTAKAFGLDAIDMVCVNYKDSDYLKEECIDGKQLGFTGKQAIHPSQISVIQSTFLPSSEEISRAVQIINTMIDAHDDGMGAVGLEGRMIDFPVLRQARATIRFASAAGLEIPPIKASPLMASPRMASPLMATLMDMRQDT